MKKYVLMSWYDDGFFYAPSVYDSEEKVKEAFKKKYYEILNSGEYEVGNKAMSFNYAQFVLHHDEYGDQCRYLQYFEVEENRDYLK